MLKGLLGHVAAQAVNLVNAHLVARDRGVAVVVRTDESAGSGYTNLITVTTQAGTGRKIIAGTVFDGTPRIVRLRDLHIEFIPEGHILVLSYERPAWWGRSARPGTPQREHRLHARRPPHQARRRHRGAPPRRGGGASEVMEEVAKAVEADFA